MNPSDQRLPQEAEVLLRENLRLRRAVDELSILNDLARTIGASRNTDEIIQTIIRRSLRAVGAEQGVITLVQEQEAHAMKTLVRTNLRAGADHPSYHLSQSLLGWMQLHKKPLIVNNPRDDTRFQGVRWDDSIRNTLCVPLMVKAEVKGVLAVYNKKEADHFTEEDQRLLSIIAAQSSQVIENARLYEHEKELIVMQQELRVAAQIHHSLLPQSPPSVPGYDIAGRSIPAHIIGGDYFDFIPMEDGRFAVCLGDVSGKGLGAALLMANTQATLRGQTILLPTPKECIDRSNRLIFRTTQAEKFVTLFYGILDPATHRLAYCNAGHDNPFLFHADGSLERLSFCGTVLGIMEEFPYEEHVLALRPGDLMLILSDGISEAMNVREEDFGEARIRAALDGHTGEPAGEIVQRLLDTVRSHVGDHPASDDMTIIALRRTH